MGKDDLPGPVVLVMMRIGEALFLLGCSGHLCVNLSHDACNWKCV